MAATNRPDILGKPLRYKTNFVIELKILLKKKFSERTSNKHKAKLFFYILHPFFSDPAVLRPGRLDKILYVGYPEPQDRCEILKALTKNGSKPNIGNFEIST